jgi:hypothetical protein
MSDIAARELRNAVRRTPACRQYPARHHLLELKRGRLLRVRELTSAEGL